ncbi:MAG: MalY/PatB family protein [Candidatus Cryptobacteroides sp.]
MVDFEEILDRKGSDSIKWDLCRKKNKEEDLIPMWIADMDFRTPSFVYDEIRKLMDSGVLGYTHLTSRWYDAIISWYSRRYSVTLAKEQMTYIPGIVRGIAFAELCFTDPGDKVLLFSPVYHPFTNVTRDNGREVVRHSLVLNEETMQYEIDFALLEKQIKGCKMMILCNPHNPGGRVWTEDELRRIAELADGNGCLVISDEIHCDLTSKAYVHHPFFTVSDKAAHNSIVFGAPSKAFNMPGVVSSYAIVKNSDLFARFKKFLSASELDAGGMFAYNTCAACYEKGDQWISDLLDKIRSNYEYLNRYLRDSLPMLRTLDLQATYLVFLDCRALGLDQDALVDLFEKEAGLLLNNGEMFGPEGKGFMRLNIGCPQSILETALDRLAKAIKAKGLS